MGVIAAWIYSVLFLPALISVLPVKVKVREERSQNLFDKLSASLVKRRSAYLWGSAAAILAVGFFINRIELNDQWVEYFDESMEFRQDSDYSMKTLTGIYTIEYSIEAGESGGVSNPEYLRKLDEFGAWYRAQPGVKQVVVLSDVMKRLNKNLHGDDPDWYRIPENRDLAAQYLLLYEMSLPYGLDLNNQINVDKSASRFIASVGNMSTREVRELSEAAQQWMDTNAPSGMQAVAASPTIMFAHISERNIKSMTAGTGIAIFLIAMALAMALKSTRYGVISLLPNILPALFGFGIWGLAVGEMGLSLSIVTGMTLGIVVDDTVHFLSKYIRGRREHGFTAEEAIQFAFQRVGKALVVTTLILVVGFSILSMSTFRLNSWMGQLTAIVIVSALIIDLVFLPALLLTLDKRRVAVVEEQPAPVMNGVLTTE
jgi:predicted RND superfamily exporter protein